MRRLCSIRGMAMTKKERVLAAISHIQPDRVPKGELGIEDKLLDALTDNMVSADSSPYAKKIAARELLGMDLINIHEYPMQPIGTTPNGETVFRGECGEEFSFHGDSSDLLKKVVEDFDDCDDFSMPDISICTTKELDYVRQHSDLFCMVQINGPIAALTWMQGIEDMCIAAMTNLDSVIRVANKVMDFEIARAKIFIDHGADAVLMGEDIAFNSGLLMPPYVMDQLGWPIYKRMIKEIKSYKDIPVFMHTDGNISSVIENIIACGFDGLQSLQPSAGVDIYKIKELYGDRICLMGNVDLNYLLPFGTPRQVAESTVDLIEKCGKGGGFILSSCNILTNAVPKENALAMYRAAEQKIRVI